jgi:hypothetical protein
MKTSLIIFSGFALALCVGLVQLIRDLSEMSFHVSPDVPEAPYHRAAGAELGHANANGSWSAADLRDTL